MFMEYIVVSAMNEHQLIERVNNKLNYGWKLQGGMSVTGTFHSTTEYFQAMFRDKTET